MLMALRVINTSNRSLVIKSPFFRDVSTQDWRRIDIGAARLSAALSALFSGHLSASLSAGIHIHVASRGAWDAFFEPLLGNYFRRLPKGSRIAKLNSSSSTTTDCHVDHGYSNEQSTPGIAMKATQLEISVCY